MPSLSDQARHLGKVLELNEKQIDGVFKRVIGNRNIAFNWIEKSFLSDEYKEKNRAILKQRDVIIS